MQYTIKQLADLAGVSVRTLHYYDQIGLLVPKRKDNGYRIYQIKEVDRLQQICFYRVLGLELNQIQALMNTDTYDPFVVLQDHLTMLKQRRTQLDMLIQNVQRSLAAHKGGFEMKDKAKFEGLKVQQITKNEAKYGVEIRAKYGNEKIDQSNQKMGDWDQDTYTQVETLSNEINQKLKIAFQQGDPSNTLAREVCALHQQWLQNYWPTYSKKAHLELAEMYVADPRFKSYYDKIQPGCAVFLRDALRRYLK